MKYCISILGLFVQLSLVACNSCGCFIGSGLSGLNLQNSNWMVRYGSQFRSFATNHPSDDVFAQERHTQEHFWQNNLEVSYKLKPWLYGSLATQFARNSYTENGSTTIFTGFSNISAALTAQKLLHTADNGNNVYWINRVQFGLPVGPYKGNASNADYSESIYPSTGASFYALASQLLYNTAKSVLYLQINGSYNAKTPNGYRFGTAMNGSVGGVNDFWKIGETKTLAAGAELSFYHSFQNEFRDRKLSENNGSYMVMNPQLGYKTESFSLFVKQSFVLFQQIGAGNTTLKNQLEINLTFKI